MARPSHPTRLDYSNYTWRRVQIMNIYLQAENETVSSLSRIYNIFNIAYLLTINKLLLDTNFLHTTAINDDDDDGETDVLGHGMS
jgi:hypothetical protein